jgi:hypothetical protein
LVWYLSGGAVCSHCMATSQHCLATVVHWYDSVHTCGASSARMVAASAVPNNGTCFCLGSALQKASALSPDKPIYRTANPMDSCTSVTRTANTPTTNAEWTHHSHQKTSYLTKQLVRQRVLDMILPRETQVTLQVCSTKVLRSLF